MQNRKGVIILQIFKNYLAEFKHLDNNQKIILLIIFAIFTPYYVSFYLITLAFIYIVDTRQVADLVKSTPRSKYLILAGVLSLITCLVRGNLEGFAISAGLFGTGTFVLFYNQNFDMKLYNMIVRLSVFLGAVMAIIGLFQFAFILKITHFSSILVISSKPYLRVSTVFTNANYYATIIEFLVIMTFHASLKHDISVRRRIYYLLSILLNLVVLYTTGCRTAFLAIFAVLPIVLLFEAYYKATFAIITLYLSILFSPLIMDLIPRLSTISADAYSRSTIWHTALQGFMQHPLFGMGPHGYQLIYRELGGPLTYHAHSLYFDSLLSFGLVTLSVFFVFLQRYFKTIFRNVNHPNYALSFSLIIVVLIHGVTDITLLNMQTGLFALFLISSVDMKGHYFIKSKD